MNIDSSLKRRLRDAYASGMTASALADAANCENWQAMWFIDRRKLAEEARMHHDAGLSTRKIAVQLGTSQSTVSRAIRGRYDEP